jgi:hypothetical protein
MMKDEKAWEDFRKFQSHRSGADPDDFYGCVDADGVWFDSSVSFGTAVHWCCYYAGEFHMTDEQEMEWMNTEGRKRGYSIIHGSQIRKMHTAGLIK